MLSTQQLGANLFLFSWFFLFEVILPLASSCQSCGILGYAGPKSLLSARSGKVRRDICIKPIGNSSIHILFVSISPFKHLLKVWCREREQNLFCNALLQNHQASETPLTQSWQRKCSVMFTYCTHIATTVASSYTFVLWLRSELKVLKFCETNTGTAEVSKCSNSCSTKTGRH